MSLGNLLAIALYAGGLFSLHAQESFRIWTDETGRTVQARMIQPGKKQVKIRLVNGNEFEIPLSTLVQLDRDYVLKALAEQVRSGERTDIRIPHSMRKWPETVGVSPQSVNISVVEENEEEDRFIYRSEDFEFFSEDKLAGSVMTEVARTFEATKVLLTALPWGLHCNPPAGNDFFPAQLYETRSSYEKAGGPSNSGGVYMRKSKTFMIPFPSLGLEMRGKTWYRDDHYRNDTLIHEITHQMMDDLLPVLPTWVIEGTAEYVESIPYRFGTFRAGSHYSSLRDFVEEQGGNVRIKSLEHLMTLTSKDWHEEAALSYESMKNLYTGSYLLVYYFNHLDGEGNGFRFMSYMDHALDQAKAWETFFADPRVKKLPNGRYRYSSDIQPPQTDSFSGLPLLLDGRSYATLADEIEAAFKKKRVKLNIHP